MNGKESKYSRDNPPPFSDEELREGLHVGKLVDDEGNIYLPYPTPRDGKVHEKTEFYCEALHISVPVFKREQKPIDPNAKHIRG